MDLILRGGRVIDPAAGLDATCDVGFANGRVAARRAADRREGEGGARRRGRHRHAGHDRPPHARLLGRHVDRRRGRADRAPERHHDVRRRRHGGAGEFPGLPAARDRAVARAHPRLSQRLVRRHLRVQPHRDGRRIVGPASARPQRMRARGAGESRPDRGHQGARGPRRRRVERRGAARHGARSRRRARLAGDGAHRPSAAFPQGSAGAAAPRRRAHALLPAVSEFAAALRRRACARRRCSPANAA